MADCYISNVDLITVVRIISSLELTGRMYIVQDHWDAELSFDHGQLVAAEFGEERGTSAMESILLAMSDGHCTLTEEVPSPEHNIGFAKEELETYLNDLSHRWLDWTRTVPSLTAVPRIVLRSDRSHMSEELLFPRSALTTLMMIDGRRTVEELSANQGISRTVDNLAKLVNQGLIYFPADSVDQSTEQLPAGNGPSQSAAASRTRTNASDEAASQTRWRLLRTPAARLLAVVLIITTLTASLLVWLPSERNSLNIPAWLSTPREAIARSLRDLTSRWADNRTQPPSSNSVTIQPNPSGPEVTGTPSSLPAPSSIQLRPVLDERFVNTSLNWPSNSQSTAWIADGAYRLFVRQPGQFVAIGAPIATANLDVVVSTTIRKLGGPAGGGYGLIVRDQGPGPRDGVNQIGNFYALIVNDRGEVAISRRENDHWVEVFPWTLSAAVHTGNTGNELVALAIGSRLGLAVNGTLVASVEDPAPRVGAVGLYVGGDLTEAAIEKFLVEVPMN